MSKSLTPQSDSKKNVIKVLIVDDIPETRENLKKLLAFESDIEVVGTASTGREGVDLAKELVPDIILMDINMPDMDGISATEQISKAVPQAGVVMMSVQSEADYLRRAMLAGARDFLTKPISGEELYSTVRSVYDRRPAMMVPAVSERSLGSAGAGVSTGAGGTEAHVIAIYSPQGGSGKTTIATNVAAALMREGTKVLLVDCDLQFGDVGVFLNLQSQRNIVDLVRSVDDLDLDLAPGRPEDAEEVLPDKTAELIQKLRGVFDFIVVDMASKLDDLAVALFDVADRIVLVLNPTLPSVKSVRIILDLFGRLEYPEGKAQIVINKVTQELERLKVSIPVAAIESNLKRKPLGVIPMDERKVLAAINRGVTVIAKDRALPPAKDLVALADALRASVAPEEQERMTPAEEAKSVSRLSRLFGG
jgi:pilus assembly protein CpaE